MGQWLEFAKGGTVVGVRAEVGQWLRAEVFLPAVRQSCVTYH